MLIPQSTPDDAPGPDLCAGRKVTETHKALLWKLLNDDPTCPSRLVLHAIAETPEQIAVSLRHINRLRGGVPDLDVRMSISRMCSRLQPLTSRSGTRPCFLSRLPFDDTLSHSC
jgi:hypothetical protein